MDINHQLKRLRLFLRHVGFECETRILRTFYEQSLESRLVDTSPKKGDTPSSESPPKSPKQSRIYTVVCTLTKFTNYHQFQTGKQSQTQKSTHSQSQSLLSFMIGDYIHSLTFNHSVTLTV